MCVIVLAEHQQWVENVPITENVYVQYVNLHITKLETIALVTKIHIIYNIVQPRILFS